jgi:quinolinate synthase
MKVVAHNYQVGATQEVSDHVYGTTGIVRNAGKFKGEQVLFCGVLYMAEDLYVMSGGEAEVFIPEIAVKNGKIIHPRCPMIRKQYSHMAKTDVVAMDHVKRAREMDVDMVLAYINTPISMKGACDGVYNGTLALQVIDKLASENGGSGAVALIGDENVNGWIADMAERTHPDFKVLSVPATGIYCPSHLTLPLDLFKETWEALVTKYGEGNVGMEMHAEVDPAVRQFGFEHDAYFGGTGGLITNVKESELDVWLVATVEGVVDRLRRETSKKIFSLNLICPNMSFTSPKKIAKAKEILAEDDPAAEIRFVNATDPYYEIEILDESKVRHQTIKSTGERNPEGFSFIPAVKLTVAEEFMEPGKKALNMLL